MRRNPTPDEVARLAHTHGWSAVFERWWYHSDRDLRSVAKRAKIDARNLNLTSLSCALPEGFVELQGLRRAR